MNKRDLEVMWNYYYGTGKSNFYWKEEFEILDQNEQIKKIYQVIDKKYNECWFFIRDFSDKSYLIKEKKEMSIQ